MSKYIIYNIIAYNIFLLFQVYKTQFCSNYKLVSSSLQFSCNSNTNPTGSYTSENFNNMTTFSIGFWARLDESLNRTNNEFQLVRLTADLTSDTSWLSRILYIQVLKDKPPGDIEQFFINWYFSANVKSTISDAHFTINNWYYFWTAVDYGKQLFYRAFHQPEKANLVGSLDIDWIDNSTFFWDGLTQGLSLSYLQTKLIIGSYLNIKPWCGLISDVVFISNFYYEDGYEYYFRNGLIASPILFYEFNENAGQYVVDQLNNNANNGVLGTNDSAIQADPVWSINNQDGIYFTGTSLIQMPTLQFNAYNNTFTFAIWIRLTAISNCDAIIFKRQKADNKLLISYYIIANTNQVWLSTYYEILDTQIVLPINNWIFFTLGCGQAKGRPTILCYQYNYNPQTSISKKAKLELLQSNYMEYSSDKLTIGDSFCSFTGYLRQFFVYGGSMSLFDGLMNCQTGVILSLQLVLPIVISRSLTNNNLLYGNMPDCTNSNYGGTNYYPDYIFNRCSKCDMRCTTCTLGQNINCSTCNTGFISSSPSYLCNCNDQTKYFDQFQGSCISCDTTCLTCYGSSNTQCLSCDTTKNPPLYLYSNSCVNPCPNNTYADSISGKCLPCDISCLTCSDRSPNSCLTCSEGNVKVSIYGKCLNNCPFNGMYLDPYLNTCEPCHSTCYSCTGPNPSDCISCANPGFYYNNTCVLACPPYFYGNSAERKCMNCPSTCLTCDGNTTSNCLSCFAPLLYNAHLKTCSIKCELSNQYPNMAQNICNNCDNSCETCFGPKADNCLTCTSPNFFYQNKCLSNCDPGYMKSNDSPWKCISCPTNCSTCSGPNGNIICLSCFPNSYLYNNSCINTCPAQYFPAGTQSWACQPCTENCQICSAPLIINTCLECNPGYYLYLGKCQLSCPSTGWYANTQTKKCEKCDSSCQTCSGSIRQSCLTCTNNRIFYNNQCLVSCPSGYIYRSDSNSCIGPNSCDSLCRTCTMISTNCSSCYPGTFLANNTCYSSCPDGTYPDLMTATCKQCNTKCKTCYGPQTSQCTSCSSPFNLVGGPIGYCDPVCSTNQYYDRTLGSCSQCHPSCQNCISSSSYGCILCNPPYLLSPTSEGNCIIGDISLPKITIKLFKNYTKQIGMLPLKEHIASWDVMFFSISSIIFILYAIYIHAEKISCMSRLDIINFIKAEKANYQVYKKREYMTKTTNKNYYLKMKINQEKSQIDIKSPKNDDEINIIGAEIELPNIKYENLDTNIEKNDQDLINPGIYFESNRTKRLKIGDSKLSQNPNKSKNKALQEYEVKVIEYWANNQMIFHDYYLDDLKHNHSFLSIFTYQSLFSPSYIRAMFFIMKIAILATTLEIFYLPQMKLNFPEYLVSGLGSVSLALISVLSGIFSEYISALIIRPRPSDIHNWINCQAKDWAKQRRNIYLVMAIKQSLYSILFLVTFGGLAYFHIIFELLVDPIDFKYWAILFLIAIIVDQLIIGLSIGIQHTNLQNVHIKLIIGAIAGLMREAQPFTFIEIIIGTLRNFRSMRDYIRYIETQIIDVI